jgi:DNA polymerase (family 10)
MSADELTRVPGVGKDLSAKIVEYLTTGRIHAYEELKKEIPPIVLEIEAIPGVGPRTAMLIYEKLAVKSLDELARLASGHKLSGLPGIREKTEQNILKGISMLRRGSERRPLGRALPLAGELAELLRRQAPLERIDVAGSIRRRKDTVKDIDILAVSDEPEAVMRAFVGLPHVKDVLMRGPTRTSVTIDEGLQVDLRVVGREAYGAALAYFTGSKEHNVRLREMAVKKGLTINEYGIFRVEDNKKLGGGHEEDVYNILGMQYVPPELREDRGEIEAALSGSLPRLVCAEDIRGDLHAHSSWSDGANSIEQLALAAMERGYSYLAVTDHSKGLGIAHGLTAERLLEQGKEVEAVNRRLKGIRVLHGIEVDIRADGSIDLPDEVLETLDIVVASVHSGFKQPREQMTARILKAIGNPYVSILGHPTGRLLGERDSYAVDMDAVLKAASRAGVSLEINAFPLRLDLNDIFVKKAKELGVEIAVNTDAHDVSQFDYMGYGVSVARRGWLEKKDVINTYDLGRLLKRLRPSGAKGRPV